MPQFILRNFTDKTTGKVGAFDKATRRCTHVGVRTAAQAPDFNKDSSGDEAVERLLGREVETPASAAVRKLVDSRPPAALQPDDLLALRRLVVVQVIRGTRQRRVNTLMIRGQADLIGLGGLAFDERDDLTQDSQLRVVTSFLKEWQFLGCARWNLELLSWPPSDGSELLVPDQGVVAFHPDLAVQGWTDATIDEMSCLFMPISPQHALVLVNPSFSRNVAVPDAREVVGVVYSQADQFIYGTMSEVVRDNLLSMMLPDTPDDGPPIP